MWPLIAALGILIASVVGIWYALKSSSRSSVEVEVANKAQKEAESQAEALDQLRATQDKKAEQDDKAQASKVIDGKSAADFLHQAFHPNSNSSKP